MIKLLFVVLNFYLQLVSNHQKRREGIGDAFVKEEPRTLFMKSKNGQLIKDSHYLTLQIAKKTAVECLVVCCLRLDNLERE